MLKQRILTAAILIPLVVYGILNLPTLWFAYVWAAVILLGAWEWSALARTGCTWQRIAWVVVTFALLATVWIVSHDLNTAPILIHGAALFWLFIPLLLATGPVKWLQTLSPNNYRIFASVMGFATLTFAWLSLSGLHSLLNPQNVTDAFGPKLVMYLFCIVWAADIGAYFSGKRFGRRKLAISISPGKSWEGAIGGFIATGILALLASRYFGYQGWSQVNFILVSQAAAIISVYGDLFVSVFKRASGIKDSGKILPGHGGILDRVDSTLSAAPVFLSGLLLLELIR